MLGEGRLFGHLHTLSNGIQERQKYGRWLEGLGKKPAIPYKIFMLSKEAHFELVLSFYI